MTGVGGVAIYTLRGDCGSVRVAVRIVIPKIKATETVAVSAVTGSSGGRLGLWPIRSGLRQAIGRFRLRKLAVI
jgi:hypothetical protein